MVKIQHLDNGHQGGNAVLAYTDNGEISGLAGFALRHAADAGWRPHRQLLPPLAQVQNDLSVVYTNGCHLGVAPTAPAPDCRLGDAPSTVLLFGDSHAAQWVPALVPAAVARGHAVLAWTKSSCPSADVTVWNPAARGPYRECDAWREAVFAKLAEVRPAFVVIANLDDAASEFVDRATCDRPRTEALPAEGPEQRIARATGTPLWDLTDAACGHASCPALLTGVDGRPLVVYRDDNHFGARFVVTLAPALGRAWDAAPPRR